jgi:hypothetical protein
MNDDSTMISMMSIDLDIVIGHYSMMMNSDHENYFDVATEENLLVAIQTRIHSCSINVKQEKCIFLRTFFSICVCDEEANADAIVSPRILS